jgi:hypothetical protein
MSLAHGYDVDDDDRPDPRRVCPECGDREVVAGGYTCLPCWRRLTKARETRRPTTTLVGGCDICGRARAAHESGYEGLRSSHQFVGSADPVQVGVDGKPRLPGTAIAETGNDPLQPLRRKGSRGGFASTRSRGGRPKLSKTERVAAANARRERQARWVANRRSQRRRDRRQP